ncbi:endonuclease domain-containing protein [Glacieibacterium frigidum]|uniref:DUF559 domain-containing protein n=1 Tax=Glacieibacterium frigidum TaxID=2593303 RepID=A0A552U828_9SPHN|nr:DUF559 domain-containing protein [Glacieibacterium frigidum]TRW14375.1 DUF559 domain-containing protein [Glacieibacterium frigidum]
MKRVAPPLTKRARELRNNATPAERAVWRQLRHVSPRFTRQLPIGPFIADFACRTARIVVELDGRSHDATEAYDAARTRYLEAQGWTVLRFANEYAREWPEGVAGACQQAAEAGGTHPRPLPEEGGGKRNEPKTHKMLD